MTENIVWPVKRRESAQYEARAVAELDPECARRLATGEGP